MKRPAMMALAALFAPALCGCQAADAGQLAPASTISDPVTTTAAGTATTPASTPSPTPGTTATPTPTPTASTASVLDDGKTVFLAEGDSITAPHAAGTYAWDFGLAHPQVEFYDTAVGGSGLANLLDRRNSDMALHPDILTVFIGANDFNSTDPAGYAQRVFDYVAPFRAMGTKVYIATILPQIHPTVATFSADAFNTGRRQYARIIQDAVGKQIDGIIDFGGIAIMADDGAPYNTQLYIDGLHPTWRGNNGGIGGHDYLYDLYTRIMDPVVQQALANQ